MLGGCERNVCGGGAAHRKRVSIEVGGENEMAREQRHLEEKKKKEGESEEFEFRLGRVQAKCLQTRFLFAFGLPSLHSTSDAHDSIDA